MSDTITIEQRQAKQSEEAKRLLEDINAHLHRHPMGRAYFAFKSAGYSNFVTRLEQGFGATAETEERVRRYMATREGAAE